VHLRTAVLYYYFQYMTVRFWHTIRYFGSNVHLQRTAVTHTLAPCFLFIMTIMIHCVSQLGWMPAVRIAV